MTDYFVAALLWIAGIFTLIAAIGLLRFPDVYLRMHASTKAGTVGVISSLLALALHFDDPAIRVRALLIALFLCITAPIVGHVLSRAALLAGVPLTRETRWNEWGAGAGSPGEKNDLEAPSRRD
jgi:multicomponent Na+:H+ antiporter subunit G